VPYMAVYDNALMLQGDWTAAAVAYVVFKAVVSIALWGVVVGGWQMGRAALAASEKLTAGEGDARFLHAKIATARFYADFILPQSAGFEHTVTHGADSALALEVEAF